MAEAIAKQEIAGAKVPATARANRFSRYRPEEEKAVRKAEVVENETLERLKEAWKACTYRLEDVGKSNIWSFRPGDDGNYVKMTGTIDRLRYGAGDIERFSIALSGLQDKGLLSFSIRAGFFLSALMNNCTDTDFVIHTRQLSEPIDALGYRNTKNIVVDGDAGLSTGMGMEGGSIIVDGNAGGGIGFGMFSGSITVMGNAGACIGWGMNGGSITVNGNAGDGAGSAMRGGEIHLNGDYVARLGTGYYPDISRRAEHGRIFHKGVLIFER